jgi:hypothetical protein
MVMNQTSANETMLALMHEQVFTRMQASPQEYREGYVRGYSECATALMDICEAMFADTIGIEYVRARLVSKIEDAAIQLDRLTETRRNSFVLSYKDQLVGEAKI